MNYWFQTFWSLTHPFIHFIYIQKATHMMYILILDGAHSTLQYTRRQTFLNTSEKENIWTVKASGASGLQGTSEHSVV